MEIEEVRLVADLRIMHSKVDELHRIVNSLKGHHNEKIIHRYADQAILQNDLKLVDQIYLWFVRLKEEAERRRA